MAKISLLIFSINEVKEVISLSKELYGIIDDIVVVDSSDDSNFKRLVLEKKWGKLTKMNLFHAPALGYAEPFRSYGISKCKNEWILLLDTDERLSADLKHSLKKIVDNADFNVLKIKRFENVGSAGKNSNYFTWQVRLFKKNSVEFLGLTHETPIMKGIVKKLNSKIQYIDHLEELRHKRQYNKMDLFSRHDPFTLIIRDMVIGTMNLEMNPTYFTETIQTHLSMGKQRSQEKEIGKISRIIYENGIIKYLGLDKESTIQKLDKKYFGKKQGIDLLIKLLKDKYNNKYP